MEITPELLDAVKEGMVALGQSALNLERNERYHEDNSIGLAIRLGAEHHRQKADLLRGWMHRVEEEQKNAKRR